MSERPRWFDRLLGSVPIEIPISVSAGEAARQIADTTPPHRAFFGWMSGSLHGNASASHVFLACDRRGGPELRAKFSVESGKTLVRGAFVASIRCYWNLGVAAIGGAIGIVYGAVAGEVEPVLVGLWLPVFLLLNYRFLLWVFSDDRDRIRRHLESILVQRS